MNPGKRIPAVTRAGCDLCNSWGPRIREIYYVGSLAAAFIDLPVSRVVVDHNRPPNNLAPKYPDGAIQSMTWFGTPIYRGDKLPNRDEKGKPRSHICLGNNGDLNGASRPGVLFTCPQELIQDPCRYFRDKFGSESMVFFSSLYAGGVISM